MINLKKEIQHSGEGYNQFYKQNPVKWGTFRNDTAFTNWKWSSKRENQHSEEGYSQFVKQTQSMTEGAEILSERIHTVECINQTLSKGCDKLTDRR